MIREEHGVSYLAIPYDSILGRVTFAVVAEETFALRLLGLPYCPVAYTCLGVQQSQTEFSCFQPGVNAVSQIYCWSDIIEVKQKL